MTLNLRTTNAPAPTSTPHEVTVSHTEATVRLLRPLPDDTYRQVDFPPDGVDISKLRRMYKKRVAVVMEGEGKRARDSMDTF